MPLIRAGVPDWPCAGGYIRTFLPFHASQGEMLDTLLEEVGFLANADPARLLAALPAVTTGRGRLIARIVQRVGQQMLKASSGEQVCYLEMAAHMAGDGRLAADLAAFAPQRPWSVSWAEWDTLDDGRLLGHHDNWVLALSAVDTLHGTVLVSASAWAIRAWQLADGSPAASAMSEPPSPIADMVAFSAADDVIALTLHEDGQLRRTTLGTSNAPQTLASGRMVREGIRLISHAGQPAVVTVSESDVAEVLSAADGQPVDLAPISLAGRSVLAAGEISGQHLLVTATGGEGEPTTEVLTWDMSTGVQVGPPLRPAQVFPDRRWPVVIGRADIAERNGQPIVLIGGSGGGPIAEWDPVGGKLTGEPDDAGPGAFRVMNIRTRDGDLLCWGDAHGNLFLRSSGDSEPRHLAAHDSGIEALTGCRATGGIVIITGGRDGAVRAWNPDDAHPPRPARACDGLVVTPATDRSQPLLATISAAGTGQVRAAADGRILAELPAPAGAELRRIALLPGETPGIVTVDSLNQVAIWRPPDCRPAQVWQLPADGAPDAISVIGGTEPILLAALPNGRLVFLDLTTGQQPRTPLTCHDHSFSVITDAERKPDGGLRFITAAWHAPREVRLWTLTSGEVTSCDLPTQHEPDLRGQSGILAGSFGQLHHQHIAIGAGAYSRLSIWDASNGKPLMRKQLEQTHRMLLADVDIGKIAGETVILSGGYTCSLALWRIDSHEERHLWVGSPLSFVKSLPADRAVVAGPRGIIAFNLTPGVTAE